MKKQIVGWAVFAGLLLIIGIGIFRSVQGNTDVKEPESQKETIVPELQGEVISYSTNTTGHAVSVASNDGSLVETEADLVVLEERQHMQANGNVERRRLLKREGKYPNRLLIETLQRDRKQNKFIRAGRTEMVADHIIVSLRSGGSFTELEKLADKHNASVLRSLSDGNTHVVQLAAPGLDAVEEAITQFTDQAADVAYAEPDYVRHFSKVPNDLQYGDLWGMPKVSAPLAWDITTGSKDVVVAVIDTGMDMDHPDLLSNLWDNPSEVPGDHLDNDGNGYVDDINGWDFVSEDEDPDDADGHGTHCAGTVGAVGNNANQVVGVCWDVSLMPLRIGTSEGIFDSDIVDGIRYAARNGAKVLSNSYGGEGFSQTVYDAVAFANDQGAIFVAAAGNDSSDNDLLPQYPASYDLPNVISVAASSDNDQLASFSNYGATSVDLAAAGVDILSTYLNGQTESLQGTSMACPQVAGALGLLVSVDSSVTPAEAKQLVMASVDPVASLSGKVVTGGRLNVHAMFTNANDTDGDGMPDSWEQLYGFNPNSPSDALLDPDADFLNNLLEFQNGCIPTNSDSDMDSLIDGWEIRYGFNPLDVHGTLPRLQYLGFSTAVSDVYDIVVDNGYAYVADGINGLRILDLAEPENPVLVGSYATSGSARGVAVDGSYAYVADALQGLFIIDVSDPADPTLSGSLASPAAKVAVDGSSAFLAASSNGLRVVNITNPASPVETTSFTGNYDPNFMVNDVTVAGGYVYMALDGGLGQIASSGNAGTYSVKPISDGNGNTVCTSVNYNGSELYVTLQNYGVLTYDLSKNLLGGVATPGTAEDVAQSEGLIYVADGKKGLQIYDGSNLASISHYTSYANVPAYGVTVANGYAYVAGGTAGLQIFRSSVDADFDGMYDGWEIQHFGGLSQGAFDDFDSDGIVNWGEYLVNLVPTNNDQDSDLLIDGFDEVRTYLTDPRTSDTDGDGLSDSFEVTTNAVDNFYFTDPLLADTDGDGMTDKWELDNGLNPLFDDGDLDPDNDGATNREEEGAGTDPQDSDSDDDLMPDGWEIDNGLDPLVNDAANDPDGDNTIGGLDLTNLGEYMWNSNGLSDMLQESTDPLKADSDSDMLGDNWEMIDDMRIGTNFNGGLITNQYLTDPNLADTDGDGMPDGWEEYFYLSPVSTNGDDGATGDMDSDGLSNYEEYLNGSDPFNNDTDSDGFLDDWERDWGTQATNAADPLVVDDDGPFDWWMHGGQPQDPLQSDPDEDGSKAHPFDAIQEAINVASNGYTILVKEGQYYGFGNREINSGTLQLRILAENQTNTAATVIKSHGLSAVIIYEGGQQTNSVLAGFTIQSSMQGIDCSNGDCGEENGIVCKDASSPLITNCVVEICRDDAIYCEFNSSPIISNVIIRTIYEGHGIYAKTGSTPMILDCVIDDISTGSGIYATDSVGLQVSGTSISDCDNEVGPGRGIWLVNDGSASIFNTTIDGCQGGIRCDNSSPTIDRCTISNNAAPDYYTFDEAGFFANTNIAVAATLENSELTDERNAEENGGGILLMSGSFPLIQNSVIHNNRTWASDPDYSTGESAKPYYGLGGGVYAGANCSARMINCTVADNNAMTLGGGFTTFGNFVEHMRNDIIWSNDCNAAWLDAESDPAVLYTPGNIFFNALHCNEGTSHFDPWYCDISDGFGFVVDRYNFASDPLFAGGVDYHILTNSPCVDVGTYFEAPLYDRDGIPRPLDGDTISNNYYSVDVGAYEYLNPNADTDGDGIKDGNEIFSFHSNPTLNDSDFDGMLDGFELMYGLNAMGNDADADADGDGLSNLIESGNGTDPTNEDTDGDNSPDGDEDIAGTVPTDPSSYFYVSDIQPLAGGGCDITFDTVIGRTYTVYCCTGLGGDWMVVLDNIIGDGNPAVIADPYSSGNCFYKVEVYK